MTLLKSLPTLENSVKKITSSDQKKSPLPFHHYKPLPGHPGWDTLYQEARTLAEEIRPTLEKPNLKIDRRRRLSAYWTTIKNYLTNRKRAKKGRGDLMPLYFIWTTLRSCNFVCSYCDDHQGKAYPLLPSKGALNTEEGVKLLKIMRSSAPSVYFAGGEPTIRQDLPELSRAARDLHYYPIIVNTNGSLLHRWLKKEAWKTYLADTDIIVVSLDGLNLSMLEGMWKYRKPEDVIRNLLMLRELSKEFKFKLMVNTVIQPGKAREARAVLDLVNDLGIWYCPVPQNIGPTIHSNLLKDPEYLELAETIIERKKKGYKISGSLEMNQKLLFAKPLNCRNSIKPHIDFDGKLVWPCKASFNVKPRYINVLDFEDVDSLYRYASEQISPDNFHGPGPDQCGANCNWAQNYTTDLYYQGLLDPLGLVKNVVNFLKR